MAVRATARIGKIALVGEDCAAFWGRDLPVSRASKKRSRGSSDDKGAISDGELDENDYSSSSEIDVSDALNGLGYMSHHHHLVLGQGPGPKVWRTGNLRG